MDKMDVFRKREKPQVLYEEIIELWRGKVHSNVFSGQFLISFVTNTNQIENIDVDFNTTRELFETGRLNGYTGDLRDAMSVLNNKRVATYLNTQCSESVPVSIPLIKEVHRLLLFASIDEHRYWDNGERAGEFKHKDYCVGRLSVGSTPETVEEDLLEVCAVLPSMLDKDPAKVATYFQCYFENIHPFADGNGRVGRWLTNYILVQGNHPPILFTRERRQQYYKALELFDSREDYSAMYDFIKEQTVLSWPALRDQI